jgi:hypothetical protein
MKYAVEMGSSFRHSKVDRGKKQTRREHGGRIRLFLFFQNKESRPKIKRNL